MYNKGQIGLWTPILIPQIWFLSFTFFWKDCCTTSTHIIFASTYVSWLTLDVGHTSQAVASTVAEWTTRCSANSCTTPGFARRVPFCACIVCCAFMVKWEHTRRALFECPTWWTTSSCCAHWVRTWKHGTHIHVHDKGCLRKNLWEVKGWCFQPIKLLTLPLGKIIVFGKKFNSQYYPRLNSWTALNLIHAIMGCK